MKPRVIKYAECFEVYDGIHCYCTDKSGAIRRVSQLMKEGKFVEFYNGDTKVSSIGFFTNKVK